jgi:hypothetical protein
MSGPIRSLERILCAHLLQRVGERLIDVLCSLTPHEWEVQTMAPSSLRCAQAQRLFSPS